MHFGQPEALNGLLLVPLVWILVRRGRKKRREALLRFGNPALLVHLVRSADEGRRRRKERLLLVALLGLVFALARPQYGETQTPVKREGIDIVFAVDASHSMLAEDLPPNRLARSLGEIGGILDRLHGDRVGIVTFAGTSLPTCPLTVDYGAVRIFLGGIDAWTVPTGGTAIARALRRSIGMLDESAAGSKAVVLLTDGEDHEGDLLAAADEAAEAGIRIFTIGLGSAEGELIPLPEGEGNGFKRDREGEFVVTRRDDEALRALAAKTGGRSFVLADGPNALDRVVDALSGLEKREYESKLRVVRAERYVWFLLPATLLLLLEFLLGTSSGVRREAWSGRIE